MDSEERFECYRDMITKLRKIKNENTRINKIIIKPESIELLLTFLEMHDFTNKYICSDIVYDIGSIQ